MKLVCLGDSLTEGYGLPKGTGWCELLNEEVDFEVINSGISGDTTNGMLSRFFPMVLSHKPSHVVIMGGTNDIHLKHSQDAIVSNVLTMFRQARHFGVQGIIGIPTPLYLTAQYLETELFRSPQEMTKEIKTLQKNLQQLSIEKQIPLIDFSFGMTAQLFLEDGVHPNEDGHRLMKENAKRALFDLLSF